MRLVKLGDDYIDPESIEALDVVTGFVEGPRTRVSLKSGESCTVREPIEEVASRLRWSSFEFPDLHQLAWSAFLVSGALWFWGIIG